MTDRHAQDDFSDLDLFRPQGRPAWARTRSQDDPVDVPLPDPGVGTLAEAQGRLRAEIRDGLRCPCCGQHAKVYRRPFYGRIARDLIVFYRYAKRNRIWRSGGWFHAIRVLSAAGLQRTDYDKLVHFGLLEAKGDQAPDGNSSGMYRLTSRGEAFVEGRADAPKWIYVYDAKCLGRSAETVTIRDILGSQFDYQGLMEG